MNLPAECVRWEDATFNCGVYFLMLDGELVYIGQSVDLRKRLANHEGTTMTAIFTQAVDAYLQTEIS